MLVNERIARIAFKIAFSGLQSLHNAVMNFYSASCKAFLAIKRNDSKSLRIALAEMDKNSGISGKMLTICNAFSALQKSGDDNRLLSFLEKAFDALLPDMQRTYDFYGEACLPYKSEFEKLAKKLKVQIRAL